MTVRLIGLDGDDTLWHNEGHFADASARLAQLLAPYLDDEQAADPAAVAVRQDEISRRNLQLFGYGAKGFTLTLIETAVEVTGGRVTGADIAVLLDLGKALLTFPLELIDGVEATLDRLAADRRPLVLVTKGDLFNQEQKVARSGLADRFDAIHIVSEKDEATYRRVLDGRGVEPAHFVMVGNSVASDVLPVLAIGGRAVHVPYEVTASHERAPHRVGAFPVLDRLSDLPDWLAREG